MIFNSAPGSVPVRSMMEPAVIVRNFDKGLTQVRSPMGPVAPPAIVGIQIRAPRVVLLPAAVAPRNGLLLSTLLHTAIAAMLMSVPILFPKWLVNVPTVKADAEYEVDYQPLVLPTLPPPAESSLRAEVEHGSGQQAHSLPETLPTVDRRNSNGPKPDYAGPQMIVSNPPHGSKGVQTIRRPNLVAPPKMTYPLRLPSMVMLPHPVIRAPIAPRFEQPELLNPEAVLTFRPSEPPVHNPVLPIKKPKLSLAPAKPVLPKIMATSEPSLTVFAATTDPEVSAPKAAVVINAVSVPPQPVPVIPDAELSARFVVGPSRNTTAVEAASEAHDGTIAGAGASNVGENLPHASVENGTGTKVEAADGHAGVASTESSSSVGPRSGSGSGTSTGAASGNKGLPGISISGGVPGRSGRAGATSPIPHGSYALTIISGGSSGGASRDLGVFSRSDTVYTVYIPMTDVGGGPDWPMQYALMSPAQSHNGLLNGLLTPPVVLKKSQATMPKTELTVNSGLVFVAGIIDENGKLQALRPMRALDGRTQAAVNALAKWEFLAAQLEGKPVPSKVLIGVSVMSAEEVGK